MLIQQNVCDIELFVKKFKFIRDFQKVFVEWKLENMLTDNIKITEPFEPMLARDFKRLELYTFPSFLPSYREIFFPFFLFFVKDLKTS